MYNNHMKARNNYDHLSRWYDFLSGSSERLARLHGLKMLDVQIGERVLEIGCGTGESLLELSSCVGYAGEVYGVDLSAGMLGVTKGKFQKSGLPDFNCLQSDGLLLPFSDESFDAVFMSFTLELLPEAESPIVLHECRRVLRDGGRLGLVSLLQRESPNWMERFYVWSHRRWPRVIDCQPIPVEKSMEGAGFKKSGFHAMSMWGLAVGILVGVKPFGDGKIGGTR